jgi:hypothetical protein
MLSDKVLAYDNMVLLDNVISDNIFFSAGKVNVISW